MVTEENNLLVRRFLDGDESAFNELVRKHQKTIYWHARRLLGNHMDADEVTQEVVITMYKKLNTFKFDSALSTWLYKITHNKSINNIRRSKLRKYLFLDDEEVKEMKDTDNLYEDFETKETIGEVDRVMNKLPVKQKEVFILKQFEGLKYREIAEITGKSEGALKANYFHALKKITELLNEKH